MAARSPVAITPNTLPETPQPENLCTRRPVRGPSPVSATTAPPAVPRTVSRAGSPCESCREVAHAGPLRPVVLILANPAALHGELKSTAGADILLPQPVLDALPFDGAAGANKRRADAASAHAVGPVLTAALVGENVGTN